MTERLMTLARLMRRDPIEAWDRVSTAIGGRLYSYLDRPGHYDPVAAEVAPSLLRAVDLDISPYMEEAAVVDIQDHVIALIPSLESSGPFSVLHNTDFALARIAYALARATRPEVIVETGVGYGVSTAFLLKALRVNGSGTLHSIDLPPLKEGADDFVGHVVPMNVREPWTLHRGSARRVLPRVLREVGLVDLFLHDSLHTRRHMTWEFDTVRPCLSEHAVVISDDVGGNSAFSDWISSVHARLSLTLREPAKGGIAGIALL